MAPAERVFLTGGTGFTGSYVLRRLLESGYSVTMFARDRARAESLRKTPGEFAIAGGCFEESDRFLAALRGHDFLVNVASLGFGHAQTIVRAAEEVGITRGLFFSTTAIFTTIPAASKARRLEAENLIQQARFPWTILRPTMIAGARRDRNLIRLIHWVDHHKFVPILGAGTYRIQPVFVEDLAISVVRVLQSSATVNQAYNLSGATVTDYNSLVTLVGQMLGRRPWFVHLPVTLSLLAVGLSRLIPASPKITFEQVLRLNEHKDFDHSKAIRDFGYAPTSLATFLAAEIEDYRNG